VLVQHILRLNIFARLDQLERGNGLFDSEWFLGNFLRRALDFNRGMWL